MTRSFLNRMTLAIALALGALTGAVAGEADEPQQNPLLSPQRWRERAYGVTLLPPLNATVHEVTGGDTKLFVNLNDAGFINVLIKKSKSELDVVAVRQAVLDQMRTVGPSGSIISENKDKIGGRPGVTIYFGYPGRDDRVKVMGHAVAMIDPNTVLVLQLETTFASFKQLKPVFEAMVQSVQFDDPRVLDQLNRQRFEAGATWYKSINPRQMLAVPERGQEQWFRIVDQDGGRGAADVGYMKIVYSRATPLDRSGTRVDVQARLIISDQAYDTLSNFFLSDDRNQEIWSIKTTVRPASEAHNARDDGPGNPSWAETGLRDQSRITVTRQTPSGKQEEHWQMPPEGYLSQVELYLAPRFMLGAPEGEMAFYTYYPSDGKITMRTEKLERGGVGALKVTTYPAADAQPQVSHYDATGQLIRRELPDGRVMLPATPQEIAARWRLK